MFPRRSGIFLLASALVGLAVVATPAAHATTITIVNLDGVGEGFNDATPAAPVGGNPGTTVGAQRLNVFTHAAYVWAALISSSVEIKVGANFDRLTPCDTFAGVLGSAGPTTAFRDFTGALHPSTWYPIALANALHGSDLDPGNNDIGAQFNSDVGTAGCLPSNPWYYGLDGLGPPGSIDLANAVLHELGHGLGFLTFVNLATGAKFLGFNDTFMLNLERHGATPADYSSMTDAQRVAASTDTGNLHWVGSHVQAASGTLTAGTVGTHVRMYAPAMQEPGSSVFHWDTALTPDQLLEPLFTHTFAAPILELPLFQDIGWTMIAETDLAVVQITAPATVAVSPNVPATKPVKVQFQNRSNHAVVLPDASVLGDGKTSGLVRLAVGVVDNGGGALSEGCQAAGIALDTTKNALLFSRGAKTVNSKAKLTINFLVTYQCSNPLRRNIADPTPGDYSYTATVFSLALGFPDRHPDDDACPHNALATPFHKDPSPNGTIIDKGCGARKPDGTLGNPVVTDVTKK